MTVQENFTEELKDLLKKYKASLSAEDHWTGYPECGKDVRMTVDFEIKDENGFYVDDLELGRYFDGE